MKIFKYETEEEAERIIAEQEATGYKLVDVQNTTVGNFLGFQPPEWTPPPEPTDEVQKLTKEIETLRAADLDNKEMINGLGEMLMSLMEG